MISNITLKEISADHFDFFCFLRFTIYMRRKPLYYVMNIMLPCLMLSLLDLLVFCLPPESGEKVSLGITVLLSFSVFLLVIADNVPQTSETAPLLGKKIGILYIRIQGDGCGKLFRGKLDTPMTTFTKFT